MGGETTVFYAWSSGEGTYLFVPENHVADQIAIMRAFFEAKTWGEFWRALPPSEAEAIRSVMRLRWEEAEDVGPSALFPYDGDVPLDPSLLPWVEDGDWPPILNREITEWLPRELLQELSGISGGPASGAFLTVGSEDELALLEIVFARHGYRLRADHELVSRASGWWWQGERLSNSPRNQ